MKPSDVEAAATALVEARINKSPIDEFPEQLRPQSAAEAQAIEDQVASISGWPVLGWKVGCTSVASQELLGTDGPFAGRIYSISESGAPLPANAITGTSYLEGEFAFTFDKAVVRGNSPVSADQILEAVGDLRLAIEIVGGRFKEFIGMPVPSIIADAGSNDHLVLGQPSASWSPFELPAQRATMAIDDTIVASGSGHDVLGNPINSLLWLANHLADRDLMIEAGQVVTTGTATKVTVLPVGSTAVADFGVLGSVSTSLIG